MIGTESFSTRAPSTYIANQLSAQASTLKRVVAAVSQSSKNPTGKVTVPSCVQPLAHGHDVHASAPVHSASIPPCASEESTPQTTNFGRPPSVGNTFPVMTPVLRS